MKSGRFVKSLSRLSRAARGLFRSQIVEVRCGSVVGNKSLLLPGQLLSFADEAQIAFTVRWPVSHLGARRRVLLRLAGAPEAPTESPPGDGWLVEQSAAARSTRVLVRLCGRLLARQRRIELEVRSPGRRRRLGSLGFAVVDEAEAQRLRLQSLRAPVRQLWIESGGQCYRGDAIAEPDALLVPEFTLLGSPLAPVLPPCQTSLRLSLVAGDTRTCLSDTPIVLGQGALQFKGGCIRIKDCPLLRTPGRYRLVAGVAGREIAELGFRIVARSEWLGQLEATAVVHAQTVKGWVRRHTGALRWGTHLAFRPTLTIHTAIPAPNTPLKCLGRILLGETVFRSEEFVIRLNGTSAQVSLQPFDLLELAAPMRDKRVRLLLTVHVENLQKVAWPVIILPADSLTNFEGQLQQDSDTLSLDEEAYESIRKSLAPGTGPSASRG